MIYIYSNGGKNIGIGHVMRTLVLAKELSKDFQVKYTSSFDEEFLFGIDKIKEFGFEVLNIKNILDYINKNDILIIDNYEIKEKDLSFFREKVKVLCYIDDNGMLEYYDVDLIINQNVHGKDIKYKDINSKILAGGKYPLLRDEFLINEPIKIKKNIKNILVTVGGSDNLNLTYKILSEIKHLNCTINVVVGNAFDFKEQLIKEFYDFKNIKFQTNPIISNLMIKSDLAISACGSTLYELSYLGVPTIGLIIVDNQKLLGEYMEKNNLIKLTTMDDLLNIINNISYEDRLNLSKNMKTLIDGKGKKRIVEIIKFLVANKGEENE